jgi:hypothetical protein
VSLDVVYHVILGIAHLLQHLLLPVRDAGPTDMLRGLDSWKYLGFHLIPQIRNKFHINVCLQDIMIPRSV